MRLNTVFIVSAVILWGVAAASAPIDFRDPAVVASAFKSVVDEIKTLKATRSSSGGQVASLEGHDARVGGAGNAEIAGAAKMRFVGRGSAQRRAKGWLGSKSSPSKEAGDPVDFPPAGVGEAPKGDGKFVPWGKHIPRKESVNYYVATGEQECKLCRRIILTSQNAGRSFYSLCQLELPEYKDMCHAQQKVLQGCPEFSNDWCYQDYGGTQMLRSPCPDSLVCHYCLGLNPLHCLS